MKYLRGLNIQGNLTGTDLSQMDKIGRVYWHSAVWKDYPKADNGAGGDSPSAVAGYVESLSVADSGIGGIGFPV